MWRKEIPKKLHILPSKQPYKECKKNCEKLGGTLPLLRSDEELNVLNNTIGSKNRWGENGADRLKNPCGYEIWMPVIQGEKIQGKEDEYGWLEDILNDTLGASFLPWELSQPNGQDVEQCVKLSFNTNQYADIACEGNECCLCEFSGAVNFNLHGMPETYDVDTHYIFDPEV